MQASLRARDASSNHVFRLFEAPPAGRQILATFTYLRRIGHRAAQTRVWLPDDLKGETIEWAAARQIEIFQEADNLAIEDLEVTDLHRAFQVLGKMRAGGYRVTFLTLGRYLDTPETDDLYILDQKIQEEITKLISFLYLAEQSQQASAAQAQALQDGGWSMPDALPHVAMALGERRLFKPQRLVKKDEVFFEILGRLPASHIRHDVAMGLTLPDATKEKNWVYIATPERRAEAFFTALDTSMGTMVRHQMRGHGDRARPQDEAWHRQMAQALAEANRTLAA